MRTYTSASIIFWLTEKRTPITLNLLLPFYNRRDPERDKWADTSLARWVIPIRPNAFADCDGFIPEFSVIDAKLAEAKVHRPAGGLGCGGQLVVDALEA
mgnify:CR=1 FL=1